MPCSRHSSRLGVLSNFIIHESFEFAAKLRERALGPGDCRLDDILTADDTWDYIADRLVPRVFSDHASSSWPTSDFKNTMLGAVQLQQHASGRTSDARCQPSTSARSGGYIRMLVEAQTSDDRYGRESQFEAAMVGIELLGIGSLAPTPGSLRGAVGCERERGGGGGAPAPGSALDRPTDAAGQDLLLCASPRTRCTFDAPLPAPPSTPTAAPPPT